MSNQSHQDIQRKILGILSMRGNITVAQLAKRLRMRPHSVRYHLTQLREVGTVGKSVAINQRQLGYQVFNLLFDLPRSRLEKAVNFLKGRQEVAWFTRNIGPRRYEATIVAKDYPALAKLLADMGESTGTQPRDVIFAIEGECHQWGLRFLAQTTSSPALFHFTTPSDVEVIDDLDKQIIDLFQRDRDSDTASVAKKLGAAPSTIAYRFNRLCTSGVISEELYFVRPMESFVQAQLMLQLKSRSLVAQQTVMTVCNRNPYVECLITGIGLWDYKVVIAAESIPALLTVESAILQGCDKHLLRHMVFIRDEVLSVRTGL